MNGKGSSSKHRPDNFGPFRVRAELGASRLGPVYLGHDPAKNARVVIRTFTLSPEWREFNDLSDLLNSFRKLRETKLDYPGLARALAFGAERDVPYIVYSDLAGSAMDAVMRDDGRRPVAEVLQRTTQLADAIDFAASAGVHHGMLTPCDVFLEREWTGVTGFGLAHALIKAGIPAETDARYGSPQRLTGAAPTRADDIYSLAAITLELLIGTPADPDLDMSPALREAQGLPERRRLPRPAPHETRLFTSIPGVDAGKLRACFASAFAEEPGERPPTAAEFVASFEGAISNKRAADEPSPSVKQVAIVAERRDEPENPPAAPAPDMTRAERAAALEPSTHPEPVVAQKPDPVVERKQQTEHKPEDHVAASSRALVGAMVAVVSLGAGFAGGFIAGQRSRPSIESPTVSRTEPVARPATARPAVEDPQPIAPVAPTVAPVPPEPLAPAIELPHANHDTRQQRLASSERRPSRSIDVEQAGSLQVASRPSGAQVFVDDNFIGTTPLLMSDVAAGSRRLRVDLSGYKAWTKSVRIEPSARARVSVSLEP